MTSAREIQLPGASYAVQWSAGPGARVVLLCLHGMESHSAWLDPLAREIVAKAPEKSFDVIAYDRRGWGRASGRRGHLHLAQHALSELHDVTGGLRQTYEEVHLLGMSWGGLFALYAALRMQDAFQSLTLLAPPIFPRLDLSGVDKGRVAAGLLSGLPLGVDLPIEPEAFTADPVQLAYVRKDPLRVTRVSAQFCWATHVMRRDVERQLGKVSLQKVLVVLGGGIRSWTMGRRGRCLRRGWDLGVRCGRWRGRCILWHWMHRRRPLSSFWHM